MPPTSECCCKSIDCKFGDTSFRYNIVGTLGLVVKSFNNSLFPLETNSTNNNSLFPLETNSTNTYNLNNEEEVDFVLPRNQMIHKRLMWYDALMASSVKIDNIWLTTIAGNVCK